MEFNTLLSQIKQKPGLYIGRASINDLYMFLNGVNFARRQLGCPPSEEEREFREFQPWLQKRFTIKSSQSWSRIILFFSCDEQEAFYRFFDLLSEFVSSHQSLEPLFQLEAQPA
jgi:hypothetical protein